MIKEACVESFSEALEAEKRGANRIELCENLKVGGTTPSYGTIKMCLEKLNIPFFPMIRPRGGSFVYSNNELEIMKTDIKVCKKLGVKGIVLGILTAENKVNIEQTKELIELAQPMEVTFHKAFDDIHDTVEALKNIISCGASRILTSGTKKTAEEGIETLNHLIDQAKNRITIVAAGKVTSKNIDDLSKRIKTTEFHGQKIV